MERFQWADEYVRNASLVCDFCNREYSTMDRDEYADGWLNACEPCAAEAEAEIQRTEAIYGPRRDGPEVFAFSPNR